METAPKLHPFTLRLGVVFALIGYGTKAGLAPMHTWKPDAYREALRFSGVRALTVPTGRDAMRRVEELIPDLIILDYRLPDIHGRELCRQLRANPDTREIPILVVTASPQDDPDSDYSDAVLTKPCLLPTLLAASRLLLTRVLPTAASRPPTAPTA